MVFYYFFEQNLYFMSQLNLTSGG